MKLGESRGAEGRERGQAVKQNTGDREKDSLDMRDADNIIRGESETTEYDFSTDDESLRSCDPRNKIPYLEIGNFGHCPFW